MAHELIASVTVSPVGPVTIGLGQTLAVDGSYALNGPNPGGPTLSFYQLSWQRVSPGLPTTWAFQGVPVAGTVYTKVCPASILNALGTYVLRVEAYYGSDAAPPNAEQFVSQDITVNVVNHRSLETDIPDHAHPVGLEERAAEVEIPLHARTVGLEARDVEAEVPARSLTAGLEA